MTVDVRALSASYGPAGQEHQGVLSEHLVAALEAGLRVVSTDTRQWVVDATGLALPVLCSELVASYDEDGPRVVRCGQPVTHDGVFCAGHSPQADLHETCEHGLAAWLCAGPGHYPPDA